MASSDPNAEDDTALLGALTGTQTHAATPADLDALIKAAGSPAAAIDRASKAGRDDIATAIADHVSKPHGTYDTYSPPTDATLNSEDDADILKHLTGGQASTPPAQTPNHPGWRANGAAVEWYDPANLAAKAPGIAKAALTGAVQGGVGMATMPGTGLDTTANLASMAANYLKPGSGNALLNAYNMAAPVIHSVLPSATSIGNTITVPTGGYYNPQGTAEEYARTAGSFLPAMGIGGAATAPQWAARLLTRVLAPAAAGQASQGAAATADSPYIRAAAPYVGDAAAIGAGGVSDVAARAPGAAMDLVRAMTPAGQDAMATSDALAAIHHFAGGPVETPNIASRVPGVQPTLAEAAAPGREAGVAALQNAVQGVEPNSPLHYRSVENNTARQNFFDKTAGSPEDIERAAKARDVAANVARENIFNPTSDLGPVTPPNVDLKPVQDTINNILQSPERGRTAVISATNFVKSAIDRVAKDGITDPETAYQSIRREINDYISGKLNLNDKSQMLAASHLIEIRDALDNSIEASTPGFKDYLRNYSESSGPINAMEFLQKQNIATAQGTVTLAGVQRALDRLRAEQGAAGVKAGKSVTQAQEDALEAIRDDLLRQANITRFRTVGSNTVEKFMNQQRLGLAAHIPGVLSGAALGGIAGETLGSHLGVPGLGGELGAMAGGSIGSLASHATGNPLIRAMAQQKLEEFLLDPSKYAIARDAAARNAPIGASELLRRAVGVRP